MHTTRGHAEVRSLFPSAFSHPLSFTSLTPRFVPPAVQISDVFSAAGVELNAEDAASVYGF